MSCPWCGKELRSGELILPGRRSHIYDPMWKDDSEKYGLMDKMFGTDGVPVTGLDISGMYNSRVRAEFCPDCRKFVLTARRD